MFFLVKLWLGLADHLRQKRLLDLEPQQRIKLTGPGFKIRPIRPFVGSVFAIAVPKI